MINNDIVIQEYNKVLKKESFHAVRFSIFNLVILFNLYAISLINFYPDD